MKKKVLTMIAVLLLGFTISCEDPYRDMETEELIEMPATGDGDDEEAKPGDNKNSTGG